MGMRESFKLLGGGIVVYVVVAACGSQEPGGRPNSATTGAGGASTNAGGASSATEGGIVGGIKDAASGIADAIANPVPDAKAQTTSGTRIKGRYIVSEDGAKQWYGWHDSQRNEDCGFGTSADGLTRCLPGGAGFLGFYADPGCTQRVFGGPKGCGSNASLVVTFTDAATCPPETHVYAAGPAFSGPKVFSGTPAACSAGVDSTAYVMAYDMYTAGDEIPATTFAKATVSIE